MKEFITDCHSISQNKDFLIFKGRKVHSMRRDGTGLTVYPEIQPCAGKLAFLPGNRLLIQGGSDECYHILSLEEGRTLASIQLPTDRTNPAKDFTLSADGKTAYDYWELWEKKYVVKIDLERFTYETFRYPLSMRCLDSIHCCESGELLLMESMIGKVKGVSRTLHQLTSARLQNGTCEVTVKYQWDAPMKFNGYFANDHYVLNRDLKVYDLHTGATIDLLKNTKHPYTQRNGFHGYVYYPEEQYLLVYDGRQNDIIDCRNQKLIARYDTPGSSYTGCLIDGAFWLGTDNGIVQKPFPCVEDVTPPKQPGWPSKSIASKFFK